MKTGLAELDELISFNSGLVTFRCPSRRFLSFLTASLLARNQNPPKKSLYLHWLDYHDRFWSVDYDFLVKTANIAGVNAGMVLENTLIQRAFSPDAVEAGENASAVFGHGNVSFAILDSIDGFYPKGRNGEGKPAIYAIGNFMRLCMRNDCPGVVLDSSGRPVNPFLGEVSNAIIEFVPNGASVLAKVTKHYCLAEKTVEISGHPQKTLWRWLR